MGDNLLAITGQEVDDGDLDHGIAAGLLVHGGAGHADEDLTREGGVVDAHVELEKLVLRRAAHAFARQVDAMPHVDDVVHAGHLDDVRLVVDKVGVGLDGGCHSGKVMTFLQFDVDHAAMDAGAGGNGHGQGGLDTGDSLDGYGVAHGHTGTEVGVGDALGRQGLEQRADHAVAPRIPTGRNDAHGPGGTCRLAERTAQLRNLRVDVKTVDGVDAERKDFLGIPLDTARGGAEQGYVDTFQLADVAHDGQVGDFRGTVDSTLTTHDACYFEVGGHSQGLQCVVPDVAVTYDGGSNLFHTVYILYGV